VVELGGTFGRNVALAAILSELAAMDVVFQMAIHARALAGLVTSAWMTGPAGNGSVLTLEQKRRMREVLRAGRIEAQKRRVAPGAVLAELTLVLVLVTVRARDFTGSIAATGVAPGALRTSFQGLVEPDQWKTRVPVVIEGSGALIPLDVAAGTGFVHELSSVRLSMCVTAGAVSLAIAELGARLVTASACEVRMLAQQGKAELGVVDGRAFPRAPGSVALDAALGLPGHRVRGRVAIQAGGTPTSRYQLALPHMATTTTRGAVFFQQLEAKLRMVDAGSPKGPALAVAPAASGHFPANRVRGSMAVGAFPRRRPASHDGLGVTLRAELIQMFPFQGYAGVLGVRGLPLR
jgi:hypothetical protein